MPPTGFSLDLKAEPTLPVNPSQNSTRIPAHMPKRTNSAQEQDRYNITRVHPTRFPFPAEQIYNFCATRSRANVIRIISNTLPSQRRSAQPAILTLSSEEISQPNNEEKSTRHTNEEGGNWSASEDPYHLAESWCRQQILLAAVVADVEIRAPEGLNNNEARRDASRAAETTRPSPPWLQPTDCRVRAAAAAASESA
jgi:hypothetical protein